MKRTILFAIVSLSLLTSASFGLGNKARPQLDSSSEKLFDYQQITLENGLDVITLEDFSCPIVSVQVWYEVGSKDEQPDRQGYAHMFEHMMFKGTEHISPKDHFGLLHKVGGQCNAYTSFDRTVYHETVPADQVELALWLEAERMSFLKIDQNAFDTERKVVEEELRMGENKPYGTMFKKMAAEFFTVHPYRWTPIGNLAHLRATSVADLRAFWTEHYVPNNATVIIVGAISHKKAQALVKEYFGWIPAGVEQKRVTIREPLLTEAKSIVIDNENAPAGEVMLGWRTTPAGHKDETALEFLSQILGGGQSSRLYRDLVAESQIAIDAGGWLLNLQQDGFFIATATLPQTSQDYNGVTSALAKQIEKITTDGITDTELEKAQNQLLKALVTSNLTVDSKAQMLGNAAVSMGDVSKVNTFIDEIRAVTKEDVQRVAKHYLRKDRVYHFTIMQNQGMQHTVKDDEDAPITAKSELKAPAPGRKGVKRPKNFPSEAPLATNSKPKFNLDYDEYKLSNGLKVMVVSNHEVPFVSVKLGLTNGAWTETKPGTSSMTLAILTKGTHKHTEAELAAELGQYAISLNGSAGMDTASVQMGCLTQQLHRGLTLLSEVVLEPAFEKAEFDKLLRQQITDLNIQEQSPDYLAGKYFKQTLFGEHPYARTLLGSTEGLERLTPNDLKQWWKTYAQPDSATLIFSGDVTKKQAVDLAKRHFGQWGSVPITKPVVSDTPKPKPTTIYLVDRPGSVQAQIKIGQLGFTRHQQPDYSVGLLASTYFGGSFNSRLNESVRVKRGLTYGARGGFRTQNLAGTFEISTFTKNESAAETIRVILEQIDEFRTVEPSDAEFYDTRGYFVGSFTAQRETPQDVARDLWLIESQQLGKDYFKKLFKVLDKTSKQDCLQLAKGAVDPDTLAIIVIGNAKELKDDLAKIAPVQIIESGRQ